MRFRLVAISLACALVPFLLLPAFAKTVHDPDEFVGNPLDVRSTSLDRPSRDKMVWVVRTYDAFRNSALYVSGPTLDMDTRGDGGRDYQVSIGYSPDQILYCNVYGAGHLISEGKVSRPDNKSAKCSFPRKGMTFSKTIRWRVTTRGSGSTDKVPDGGGWIRGI